MSKNVPYSVTFSDLFI